MVLDWLSDNRAIVAAIIILLLFGAFLWSVIFGIRQTRLREKDQVFGDPERTVGGWFWAVCGVSVLLLTWFYFSWGAARAFFPQAANELCQVGKLHGDIAGYIFTGHQVAIFKIKDTARSQFKTAGNFASSIAVEAFTVSDAERLKIVISNTQRLINMMATPEFVGAGTMREIENVKAGFAGITNALATPLKEWAASEKALAQPSWGISEPEIPLLPISARGAKFDNLAIEAATLSKKFLRIRNLSPAAISLIDETKMMIAVLKKSSSANDANPKLVRTHANYLKAIDRIFKRMMMVKSSQLL